MTRPKYHRLMRKVVEIVIIAAISPVFSAYAGEPTEDFDEQRRGHVRGCPLDMDCRAGEALKAFEVEAFSSDMPWQVTSAKDGAAPTTPASIRPDLPWLSQIQSMPDIGVTWSPRVIKYLEFYRNNPRGRRIIEGWLKKQGRYRDFILAKLREANLPETLLYVAMIESSYDPRTKSYAGASGLWQFMRAGGRIYGLSINRWVDERRDPVRSTEAAVLYWKDLYDRFGSWELAMAAYNAGYGAVLRAISKYNTNDYWKLCQYENALPWGTQLYVSKVLATAIVGHNKDVFGFSDLIADSPVTGDIAVVKGGVRLSRIAKAAGVSQSDIKDLNPQFRRSRTPPGQSRYRILIPKGTKQKFAKRFPQGNMPSKDIYKIKHGERFEDIATTHGVSRYRLRRINEVRHESEATGGKLIIVPTVSAKEKQENKQEAEDNLYTSGIAGGEPDEPLIVAVPDRNFTAKNKKQVFYRVVTGDSLYAIGRALGVSHHDLAKWNGLDVDNHLHPRMILQAFVSTDFDAQKAHVKLLDSRRIMVVTAGSPEHLSHSESRLGRKRSTYTAKGKESFKSIGRKFGLTRRDLARINRMPPDTVLQPGQSIVVYKVVDYKKSKRAKRQHRRARRK